jgi:hypothetical protein
VMKTLYSAMTGSSSSSEIVVSAVSSEHYGSDFDLACYPRSISMLAKVVVCG